jgi:hypothetical protein
MGTVTSADGTQISCAGRGSRASWRLARFGVRLAPHRLSYSAARRL